MNATPYAVIGLAVVLVFGAAALQARSMHRGWRTVGRVITLAPFTVLFLYFCALVARVLQRVPGDWSDLALAIVLMGYLPLIFPALYPLAAVWLRPRTAWIVPTAVAIVSLGLYAVAYRVGTPGDSRGEWSTLLILAGAVALTAGLTWLACFLKNPRTAKPKAAGTTAPMPPEPPPPQTAALSAD